MQAGAATAPVRSGRFVTFEGGEGAGKSTQVALLAERLRATGVETLTTREPGGSPGAEEIRGLLVHGAANRWDAVTETLLHFAARRDHLTKTVWPALDGGAWVVCDRFADSTRAYQGYGHGLEPETVELFYRQTVGAFAPDLTLILDLPVHVGLHRAGRRAEAEPEGGDRYERMGTAFHERLREGFLQIAASEPERCVVIDADRPAAEVAGAVWEAVTERLGVTA